MLRFLRGSGKHTKAIWWSVAIITIVGFVGGFVFLFGAGIGSGNGSRNPGAVALVDHDQVSAAEYQTALQQQRDAYRKQFGTDPAERDQKMLESQTWRTLVTERLVTERARALGLGATDDEVSLAMRTNPPQPILAAPDFQTNGQFDPAKYRAALANPNINWAPFEQMARAQLPMRKLEERLLASIKVTEDELRQDFHDRFDRIDATLVSVLPSPDAKVPAPSEAQLAAAYEKYKGRFASGLRVQLEVLRVPKKYTDSELRDARELARSLVDRIRHGEAFAQIARDFSEGANAEQGGLISRPVSLQELGPDIGPKLAAADTGTVLDPVQDAGRFVIVKLIQKLPPANGQPQMRIAQIIVKAKPGDETVRQQVDEMKQLRARAASTKSLSAAASSKGLATFKTAYFDFTNPPNELYTIPEAAEWGLSAKVGDISPIFDGIDDYDICQVAARHDGGPATRDEIAEPIRQIAELAEKVDALKPKADAVAQALQRGATLESAAKSQGLEPIKITGMTRAQPDPRIAPSPEAIGAMLASRPGQVVGPLRSVNGWYFARLDGVSVAPDSLYEKNKRALVSEILQRRQQSFFVGLTSELRTHSKVKDLRNTLGE